MVKKGLIALIAACVIVVALIVTGICMYVNHSKVATQDAITEVTIEEQTIVADEEPVENITEEPVVEIVEEEETVA